ncbi:MAG: DUF222 domain-containing protein [bacterium]|nr:DUF222 domain-containing protein [bacterium]MDE0669769.1 DUF222 domain-containing protein [bacterium]
MVEGEMAKDTSRGGGASAGVTGGDPRSGVVAAVGGSREWDLLGKWLSAPAESLREIDLAVLRERLSYIGRARAAIAACEALVVSEVARREGERAAEEMLRQGQKRSRSAARKTVRSAGQLEWSPDVADKLAAGAITAEAAGMILDAAAEATLDRRALLDAAEAEPADELRRTIKQILNNVTTAQQLEERRAAQRRRRRASISEQDDGMYHLFAQFDPLTGNRVRSALLATSDKLYRSEDSEDRPTPAQRSADALAELICDSSATRRGVRHCARATPSRSLSLARWHRRAPRRGTGRAQGAGAAQAVGAVGGAMPGGSFMPAGSRPRILASVAESSS